jgi:hypothetical protein
LSPPGERLRAASGRLMRWRPETFDLRPSPGLPTRTASVPTRPCLDVSAGVRPLVPGPRPAHPVAHDHGGSTRASVLTSPFAAPPTAPSKSLLCGERRPAPSGRPAPT